LVRPRAKSRAAIASELREELEAHVALCAEDLVRRGVPQDQAVAQARARFGNYDSAIARLTSSARRKETTMKARELWANVQRDGALSLRYLRRAPLFAMTIALTLGLGVGANTAIFSLVDELLLRRLPVWDPGRLVNVAAKGPKFGSTSCSAAGHCDDIVSYPMFRDLQRARTPFTGLAGHVIFAANIAVERQATSVTGLLVSGSYFPVLGLRPTLGRLLTPEDDGAIGSHFVAVLSHSFWAARLTSDRDVIGKTVTVNGQPLTIVGVAPSGFDGTTVGVRAAVFVPMTMRGVVQPGWRGFDDRRSYWVYAFARLAPGVSVVDAQRAINRVYQPIIDEVEAPLQSGVTADELKRFRAKQLFLEDGSRGQSALQTDARTPLVFMFLVTFIVLLVSCANITNLLLARGANRATESAVRMSLGATRGQLVAQTLTESCVLALLGAVASFAIALWTTAFVHALMPAQTSDILQLRLPLTSLAFGIAVSLACGLLSGLVPAVQGTRPDLAAMLRAGSGKLSGARGVAWLRSVMATSQIALSLILLITAGLFLRSLSNVSRVDLGFRPEGLVTFTLSPARNGYDRARTIALVDELTTRLRALPGTRGITAAAIPILAGNDWSSDVAVAGFVGGPGADMSVRRNDLGPDYFRVMGTPVLAGREFSAADQLGAPRVAIVNRAFARKFGLGDTAVGKRLALGAHQPLDIQIVGLTADAKYNSVKEQAPPQLALPYRQDSTVTALAFYLRSSRPTNELTSAIRRTVAQLDATLPVESLQTMPQVVRDNTAVDRMIGALSSLLAVLATALAAVGLYGVLAYLMAQRTREIGIRMALGADAARIIGMVLRVVGRMVVVGGLIGVAGSLVIGDIAQALLFRLRPIEPMVSLSALLLLAGVALTAGYLPARRAARVDPVEALRVE
jgi:putative ABC transport system permease protein